MPARVIRSFAPADEAGRIVRVLYLSYHFPPVGEPMRAANVEVRPLSTRVRRRAQVVLTGPGTTTGRWTPIDHTLANEVAGKIAVFRSRSTEPTESTSWDARANRWLRSQSDWAQWWRQEVFAVGRRIPNVDVLLCSMSLLESAAAAASACLGARHSVGRRLTRSVGARRDDDVAVRHHRRLEEQAMRRSLATAAAIVMNTATAASRLRERFPEFQQKRVVSIPNGFDAEDFAGAEAERDDDAFRIVHTGYLHTQHGLQHRQRGMLRRMLGGSATGVDFLPRSHVILMAALDRLATLEPSTARRVEVWLAGALSDVDRAAIGERRNVRAIGYLSHTKSVELMRSADALFLPMHDLPWTSRATIVPGKTYEYLATGRPVIAAFPQGDARDLLETVAGTFVCRPSDEVALAAAISELAAGGRRAMRALRTFAVRAARADQAGDSAGGRVPGVSRRILGSGVGRWAMHDEPRRRIVLRSDRVAADGLRMRRQHGPGRRTQPFRPPLGRHAVLPDSIAADFALHDNQGSLVRLAQRGHIVLLTFLYTRCRDVCPLIAERLEAALQMVGRPRARVRVLIVSVDPQGDTPDAVRAFIRTHRLGPEFRYLVGTRAELQPVWQAYNVLAVPRNATVVDHSSPTLLIDAKGRPRVYYDSSFSAAGVAADVRHFLRRQVPEP